MKIGVIGAGAWGTALSCVAKKSGADVVLWSFDGLAADFITPGVVVTKDMADLSDANLWMIAPPSEFFRQTVRRAREFYNRQPIIICTKGIEAATHKFMSEVIADEIPECNAVGVLSGPQFAAQVASGVPTGSTLASTNADVISMGRKVLGTMYIEETGDIIGTEICGVGKNAVALIMGYASITAAGENEKALVLTRAWNEVVDFGLANGARAGTFLKLCGIGDLFLSATSVTSRNFSAGIAIARGEPVTGTVEGISALNGLLARAGGVEMPILCDMKKKILKGGCHVA